MIYDICMISQIAIFTSDLQQLARMPWTDPAATWSVLWLG